MYQRYRIFKSLISAQLWLLYRRSRSTVLTWCISAKKSLHWYPKHVPLCKCTSSLTGRGRHFHCFYVIGISLRVASNSYRSEHIGPVIASYSSRSDVIDKRYSIYKLSLLGKKTFNSKFNIMLFCSYERIMLENNRKDFRQLVETKIVFQQ
jgi:hypothetical protein